MSDDIFLEGIGAIELVVGKSYSDGQLEMYRILLSDVPEESFVDGINIMLRERVYSNLPLPADIRKYCLETREEDLEIRCAEARVKLKKALNSVGTYNSVVFDDPVIHMVIQSFGGWIKLGMLDYDEYEKLLKWDFPKLYKAYAVRKNKEISLVLPGRNKSDEVLYIGDSSRAKRWLLKYRERESAPNMSTAVIEGQHIDSLLSGLSGQMLVVN